MFDTQMSFPVPKVRVRYMKISEHFLVNYQTNKTKKRLSIKRLMIVIRI